MERALPFTKEHEMFREAFGKFLDKEAVPYYDEWSEKHMIDHKYYEKMGELGYLCMWMKDTVELAVKVIISILLSKPRNMPNED